MVFVKLKLNRTHESVEKEDVSSASQGGALQEFRLLHKGTLLLLSSSTSPVKGELALS